MKFDLRQAKELCKVLTEDHTNSRTYDRLRRYDTYCREHFEAAVKEIERLREALCKYADENNWGPADLSDNCIWLPWEDGWAVAREALKEAGDDT